MAIITHYFLEKGHTQNEGDSVHSVIEGATKRRNIYEPSQWYTLVALAKKANEPYEVFRDGRVYGKLDRCLKSLLQISR